MLRNFKNLVDEGYNENNCTETKEFYRKQAVIIFKKQKQRG